MTNDNYHLDTSRVSKSGLDAIDHCPASYKKKYLDLLKPPPTKDMVLGTYLHAKILEPSEYWSNIYPILSSDEREIIDGQHSAIMAHPAAKKLLTAFRAEVLHLWSDEDTGAQCKMKADCLPDKIPVVVDIKRMKDVSLPGFRRSVRQYRYDVQAAYYLDGLSKTNPKDDFIFLCVEPLPPHRVAVYLASDEMITEGREKYKANLRTYVDCKADNHYPSYTSPKIITP